MNKTKLEVIRINEDVIATSSNSISCPQIDGMSPDSYLLYFNGVDKWSYNIYAGEYGDSSFSYYDQNGAAQSIEFGDIPDYDNSNLYFHYKESGGVYTYEICNDPSHQIKE